MSDADRARARSWWSKLRRYSAELKPDERPRAWAGFFALLGIIVSHELLETARQAIFLQRRSADELPYAYLAVAAFAVLGSLAAPHVRRSFGKTSLRITLLASAIPIALLWLFSERGTLVYPYLLYLSTSLMVPIWLVGFWLHQSALWTVLDAKRIFAFFAVGGLVGNVLGSGLAAVLSDRSGPASLLVAATAVLVVTASAAVPRMGSPAAEGAEAEADEDQPIADKPAPRTYVIVLFIVTLLAAVATKLGEFLFLRGVAVRVAPENLGSTLSLASMFGSIGALGLQVFAARWIIRRFGATRTIAVLPALFSGLGLWTFFGSAYHAPFLLRVSDGTMRQPLFRTAMELLFVPLSSGTRKRAKEWVDIAGQRIGQAGASLLILAFVGLSDAHARWIALALAGLSMLWVLCTPVLHRSYVEVFRGSLRPHAEEGARDRAELDEASLHALIASLENGDEATALTAIDLLVHADAADMLPPSVLSHASSVVVLRALAGRSGPASRAWAQAVRKLTKHGDPSIRAAALAADGSGDQAREALQDPDPRVRATAIVLTFGTADSAHREMALSVLADADPETQLAVIHALEAKSSVVLGAAPLLLRLAADGAPQVKLAVARLAVKHPLPVLLPALLDMVADPRLRADARAAIARLGEGALDRLFAILQDPSAAPHLRRHVPGTIAAIGGDRAAQELVERYLEEPDERLRTKLVLALQWMRASGTGMHLDHGWLAAAIDRTLRRGAPLEAWHDALGRAVSLRESVPSALELLLQVVREERARVVDRAMVLLELRFRTGDFDAVRAGLLASDRSVRAQAVELLENIAPDPIRRRLVALAGEGSFYPAGVTGPPSTPQSDDVPRVLAEMRSRGSAVVSALASEMLSEHGPDRVSSDHLAAPLPGLAPAEVALWLRKVPALSAVDPTLLAGLSDRATQREIAAGTELDELDGEPGNLCLLMAGEAVTAAGATVGEGAVLGDPLWGELRGRDVRARSDLRVLQIASADVVDLVLRHFETFVAVFASKAAEVLDSGREAFGLIASPTNGEATDLVAKAELLDDALPFLHASASAVLEVATACELQTVAAGEPMVPAAPRAGSFGLIWSGTARTAEGVPLTRGNAIAALEAFASRPSPAIVAETTCVVLSIQIVDWLDVLEEHPNVQAGFLRAIACAPVPVSEPDRVDDELIKPGGRAA